MEQGTDPLTGFGSRRTLIADLTDAASSGREPTTFALFALGGLDEYVELYGRLEGETLLARIAARLTDALTQAGRYYRPRTDELAALIDGPLPDTEPLLLGATATLNDRFSQFEL